MCCFLIPTCKLAVIVGHINFFSFLFYNQQLNIKKNKFPTLPSAFLFFVQYNNVQYHYHICSFNDRIRDAINGGSPFGNPLQQGFSTGLFLEVIFLPFILVSFPEISGTVSHFGNKLLVLYSRRMLQLRAILIKYSICTAICFGL
jgi:hypothetical protein